MATVGRILKGLPSGYLWVISSAGAAADSGHSAGVQPGQLSTATGSAASHEELDNDDFAGEADQDRGQSGSACQVRHFPDGGGGGAASLVPRDSGTNTTVGRDPDPTSTDMMVTDASISNQPPGACDVSPGNLAHECAIRASRPPFLAREQPFVPICGSMQATWPRILPGALSSWLGGSAVEPGKAYT